MYAVLTRAPTGELPLPTHTITVRDLNTLKVRYPAFVVLPDWLRRQSHSPMLRTAPSPGDKPLSLPQKRPSDGKTSSLFFSCVRRTCFRSERSLLPRMPPRNISHSLTRRRRHVILGHGSREALYSHLSVKVLSFNVLPSSVGAACSPMRRARRAAGFDLRTRAWYAGAAALGTLSAARLLPS